MHKATSFAKITRPDLHNVYEREQFFDMLDKCRKKPVTWITAPPGAGKTTLISSYVNSRNPQCLWYQMDASDNDPATFFHYMGVAASNINPKKQGHLPHLTPEYLLGLKTFAKEYFFELHKDLKKDSLIVFDNYQEIPDESLLNELIYEGLNSIPANKDINIIVISRTVPPPLLSRLRLSELMTVITYDELRLTLDEVRGIASTRGVDISSDIETSEMLSKTEGWVAGLVLLLESEDKEKISIEHGGGYDSRAIFEYFVEDFFQKLNDITRDTLLKLSVLPIMTSKMAAELTESDQAQDAITKLIKKNYFIQIHPGEITFYQFHPLFREFLYARLQAEISPEALSELEQKAAKLLSENGYHDDAIKLFHKTSDWGSMDELICREAPTLLRQGRNKTIEGWLDLIPDLMMQEKPWLLFWKASCLLPFDQTMSRGYFEKAFKIFYDDMNPHGIFLSWAGAAEATVHGFDDLKFLDYWTGLLNPLLKEFPEFPSKEVEDRVSLWMFVALAYRSPQDPSLQTWLDKSCALVDRTTNPHFFVQACLMLVDYFLWVGDLKKADIIVEKLLRATDKNTPPPLALISINFAKALNDWFHGRSTCIKTVSDALEVAQTKGINVFNYFLFGLAATASLLNEDLEATEGYLNKAASVLDDRKRICASYYHHIVACYKLINGDIAGAQEDEELSLDLAVKTGFQFAETMCYTGMALLSFELGDKEKAAIEIKKAYELSIKTQNKLIEFICYLFKAHFALNNDSKKTALRNLKKAFTLGNQKGITNFHMWWPEVIAPLCVLALEEDIEVGYVKKLINERNLFPRIVPLELD
ncbi:MAG: hypothetical protein KAR06_06005, partial [Deltaproteobacteria bacterium]|nr:hypothetical protein [Deltaproteobacteria bacterium]